MRVPQDLVTAIGKDCIVKSLHTRDLREARRKRWAVLAELNRWFDQVRKRETAEPGSVDWAFAEIRRLRLEAPETFEDKEIAGIVQDHIVQLLEKRYGVDEEGYPDVPTEYRDDVVDAIRSLVSDEEVVSLANAINDYCTDTKHRVTPQTLKQKRTRLEKFAQFVGRHKRVDRITKKMVGSFVTSVLRTSGRALKTQRDFLSDITAFFNWVEG